MTKVLLASVPPIACPDPQSGRSLRRSIDPFLGTSVAIRRLKELARSVVNSGSPVLILGETGTGKSVLASWIHEHGPRASQDFVDLNCAGLAADFLESELFGHERGAFTGATGVKPGLIELADGGTLFLDEIGDMDSRVQAKLLKVLEEQRFRRLGDVRYRQVDVRVIAATHRDLAASVRDEAFRSDLYYRVSALPIYMAPLRDRSEDIPLLAAQFIGRRAQLNGQAAPKLAECALRALGDHHWPGNIRELNNVLERALLRQQGVITREHVSFDPGRAPGQVPTPTNLTLEEVKRRHITAVLREEGDNVDRAAARLGIPKSTLYEKIKSLGIKRSKAV